ncbi:MAG TPA: AAA family ATPase [Thermoanaerobaculia bacterium]|jgi:predicted ATPase|nr:AAA family ATPase [Thermoanaerobaculia bacterium]
MAITKIKIANFKSFEALEVDLRPLNIIVGSNAAGKSNFLEVFRFLRDLAAHGLEDAVSLQGGMEYLANLKIGPQKPVSLEVTFDFETVFAFGMTQIVIARVFQSTYRLSFRSAAEGFKIIILTDELTHRCRFTDFSNKGELGEGEVTISRGKEKFHYQTSLPEIQGQELVSLFSAGQEKFSADAVVLGSGPNMLSNLPADIGVFDFDPKLAKKASPVTGRASLEPDGSNLAIVLRNILQDKKQAEVFVKILKDALPFVDDLRVDKFADRSLLLALRERFAAESYLPASFLSDGTLHLAALILALYFDKAALTIIEEPERNIHPHLISKVVAMMQEASGRKQIVATTHNPDVVKNSRLDDLLFVRRDSQGFSRIERPAENKELKVFLENDLGVDELYVQNLLDVGYGV